MIIVYFINYCVLSYLEEWKMSSESGSVTPENDQPLSTPPSPYLDMETYLECHKSAQKQVFLKYVLGWCMNIAIKNM